MVCQIVHYPQSYIKKTNPTQCPSHSSPYSSHRASRKCAELFTQKSSECGICVCSRGAGMPFPVTPFSTAQLYLEMKPRKHRRQLSFVSACSTHCLPQGDELMLLHIRLRNGTSGITLTSISSMSSG